MDRNTILFIFVLVGFGVAIIVVPTLVTLIFNNSTLAVGAMFVSIIIVLLLTFLGAES